jgi:hypothetical protein
LIHFSPQRNEKINHKDAKEAQRSQRRNIYYLKNGHFEIWVRSLSAAAQRLTRISRIKARIINCFIVKTAFRNLLDRLDEEIPIRKTNCLSNATAGRVFVFPEF